MENKKLHKIHPEIKEIRRRRELLGMSQEALAAEANISKPCLEFLERGFRKNPRIDTVIALQGALSRVEALATDSAQQRLGHGKPKVKRKTATERVARKGA